MTKLTTERPSRRIYLQKALGDCQVVVVELKDRIRDLKLEILNLKSQLAKGRKRRKAPSKPVPVRVRPDQGTPPVS